MITRLTLHNQNYLHYGFLNLFALLVTLLAIFSRPVFGQTCQLETHLNETKSRPVLFECIDQDEMPDANIVRFEHNYNVNQSEVDVKALKSSTSKKQLSKLDQYLATYNENYYYYNNQAWLQYSKKVLPLGVSWFVGGFFNTLNLLSLKQLEMLALSHTVSTIFNAGQDVSDVYTELFRTTDTSTDPENWASPRETFATVPLDYNQQINLNNSEASPAPQPINTGTSTDQDLWLNSQGKIASSLTMMAIDLTLEGYLNHNIPDSKALTMSETASKFIKSVAVTSTLTKVMAGLAQNKFIKAGFKEDTSEVMAKGGAASGLMAALSIGAITGLTSMDISNSISEELSEAKRLKLVADDIAADYITMSTSQKYNRYFREQLPRAATVSAAYIFVDALVSTCKLGVNRLELEETISKDRQEQLCMAMVTAMSLTSTWLMLNQDNWLGEGFLSVFVENIAEAGGMGMSSAAMKFAGSLSDDPLTRDTLKMSAGILTFSAFYSRNLITPDGAFHINARNGAHLDIVIEGTGVLMSHAIPLAILSKDLAADLASEYTTEALYSASKSVDLFLNRDSKQFHDEYEKASSRYKIPIHTGCFITPAIGATTESYQMNEHCH
ncbi:hypothetical protein GZ77_03385 [Endozoicomonas montiporae]|uniref:Uncharacterized protein n=2 Tax=Endozoicomonas montiporae TaxID=1027273 RepID=A0A081NB17_9GAMM|nr:hypothetical protein [Endozoicomonas montiporae]AMO56653.1 hypothetical protein EZMO1_2577 [Endozoicomonas montiporae CL-33]KEQ15640.1 hypothetical protein GZ77_03385 [Endozoicomonas montiporae]